MTKNCIEIMSNLINKKDKVYDILLYFMSIISVFQILIFNIELYLKIDYNNFKLKII
jgi:hypothetical protein